jgi:hypothetical protein
MAYHVGLFAIIRFTNRYIRHFFAWVITEGASSKATIFGNGLFLAPAALPLYWDTVAASGVAVLIFQAIKMPPEPIGSQR